MNYYNENDPKIAAWLRSLIKRGLIPLGTVDERSIVDVEPELLSCYIQCHFFAGIGGWSRALALAGWPEDRPVWTGSCPCQPFSVAGKGKGTSDERHLWPIWFKLIQKCRPPVIFGEQVEAAIRHGWLDIVQTDLEGCGYAVGAVGLPAACVGAPHIRQRLWFVAESIDRGSQERRAETGGALSECTGRDRETSNVGAEVTESGGASYDRLLGDPNSEQTDPAESGQPVLGSGCASDGCCAGDVDNSIGIGREDGSSVGRSDGTILTTGASECVGGKGSSAVGLGDSSGEGSQGRFGTGCPDELSSGAAGMGFWSDCEWIACRDGKARPIEPGSSPLAHGVPARVVRLRGYGNAIVPQIAAEVIRAFMDSEDELK